MTDELKPCLAYPCGGVLETNLYDASLTCSRCQFQVADELEYNALVAGRQAAIDDETQNPWKAAIIDELIVDCIYSKEHESDPRKALAEAIDWNCKVALDPSVSKEAQDLQQRAIDAALESVADLLDSGDALRKDAERYRWLRDEAFQATAARIVQMLPGHMDAEIDSAMNGANVMLRRAVPRTGAE